jgi:hypothetical protein
VHSLSYEEIEKFASHRGVDKRDVELFLSTVGQAGTKENALLNLYYDARLYDWNISTVKAIEAGIRYFYAEALAGEEVAANGLESPLPLDHFSSNSETCVACGQPASSGSFCSYCQEMREELRCWPK